MCPLRLLDVILDHKRWIESWWGHSPSQTVPSQYATLWPELPWVDASVGSRQRKSLPTFSHCSLP